MNDKFLFNIRIGDWSADGHGMFETYTVQSDMPVEKARLAHYNILKETGIDIHSICNDYECNGISKDMIERLELIGMDTDNIDLEYYDDNEEACATPYTLFSIWLFLLNKVDSSLNLKYKKIENLDFYGFDENRKHISFVGYGLFSL